MTEDKLLNTAQAAEILNTSPRTLANARSSGVGIQIDFVKIGSKVLYKESDVQEYIKRNTYTHTGIPKSA